MRPLLLTRAPTNPRTQPGGGHQKLQYGLRRGGTAPAWQVHHGSPQGHRGAGCPGLWGERAAKRRAPLIGPRRSKNRFANAATTSGVGLQYAGEMRRGPRPMSKRWQWVLLLLYAATIAVLAWKSDYISMQLLVGAVFTVQGLWTLWQHYVLKRVPQSAAKVGWTGWTNVVLGSTIVCLALYGQTVERGSLTQAEIRCRKTWPSNMRPPDECGVEALRPMQLGQPAPMSSP